MNDIYIYTHNYSNDICYYVMTISLLMSLLNGMDGV